MSKKSRTLGPGGKKVKLGPLEIEEFEILPLLITIFGLVMMIYGITMGIAKAPANVTAVG